MENRTESFISAYENRIKALEELVEAHEAHCKSLEASRVKWRTEAFELLAQLKAKEEGMEAIYRLLLHT